MADHFLILGNDGIERKTPIMVSTGANDAFKVIMTKADGTIDESFNSGNGSTPDLLVLTASEALTAGNLINIWEDSGSAKMRKADSSNNRPAHGFVKEAVQSNNTGSVYPLSGGRISGLSSLAPGKKHWLGANGAVTSTSPTTDGHTWQYVGMATSATELFTEKGVPIKL